MSKPPEMNREAWLSAWLEAIRPRFTAAGLDLPKKIRVGCSFPSKSALGKKARRIGECWHAHSSAGFHELLISPLLDTDEEVAEVTAHEAAHACMKPWEGHGAAWKKAARSVGIDDPGPNKGKFSPDMKEFLGEFVKTHGSYPHQRLHAGLCTIKKQGTRMLKCTCAVCGYTCRTTKKWLMVGSPWCPTCKKPLGHEVIESDQGDKDEEDED